MIRKLRWKVVALTMLFVTAILLSVFAGAYFNARSSLRRNAEQQLQQALQAGESLLFRPGQSQSGLPCFVAEVYPTGAIRAVGSSYYQLDEEALRQIVAACLQQEKDAGLLQGYHLRYLRQSSPLMLRIAFTDSSLEQAALASLVRTALVVGVAALAVLLVCSYFLSALVTRPVEKAWQEQ